MKPLAVDTPEVTEAAAKAATQKTLKAWFAELDGLGGLAKGRKELVNHVYAATDKNEWWATTIVVEYEKARNAQEKDGKPKGYSICSTKTITAPLAEVFAAFGDAMALDAWLGPKTKVAFEDGGSLTNGDGNRATFTRIRTDKDLRIDWQSVGLAPGTPVEVLFADKGKGKTGITLNHTRIQERRDADVLRAAWAGALEALKAHLEEA
ncbi:MAG: SRPBCC domain-containing protein [Planctomycetes bacterium]|nr:SRPBCC domain-containing protein [Planctomycetota bacterium]